jgi:hypothetical protein
MLQSSEMIIAPRPTALQVEAWRLLWEELQSDPESMADCRDDAARRRLARPQMLELLRRYLAGAIETEELRATVDRCARAEWGTFGMSGMSGIVFLNRLTRDVSDQASLAAALRAVLPAPADATDGERRLRAFATYLEAAGTRERAGVARLQPGRSAFFVSAWWNAQDEQWWPSYQPSARRALQHEQGLYVPRGDVVADYFAFRDSFLALATALGLSSWELEYLCWWHHRRQLREGTGYDAEPDPYADLPRYRRASLVPARQRPLRPTHPGALERESVRAGASHTQLQWLLAKIGRRLGCRVWIAANDQGREWNGESLGSLSIQRFPSLGIDPNAERIASLIDVMWLEGRNQVAAAFEVERTSSIYSGLLRMADLVALSPNLNFPLYIVTPATRLEKVRRELSRPTFQRLSLHERCAFFSSASLLEHADSIMQWATGPDAIARLAERVAGVRLEEP